MPVLEKLVSNQLYNARSTKTFVYDTLTVRFWYSHFERFPL